MLKAIPKHIVSVSEWSLTWHKRFLNDFHLYGEVSEHFHVPPAWAELQVLKLSFKRCIMRWFKWHKRHITFLKSFYSFLFRYSGWSRRTRATAAFLSVHLYPNMDRNMYLNLKSNKSGNLARKTGPGDTAVEAEEVEKNAYPKLIRVFICISSMKQHEMFYKM